MIINIFSCIITNFKKVKTFSNTLETTKLKKWSFLNYFNYIFYTKKMLYVKILKTNFLKNNKLNFVIKKLNSSYNYKTLNKYVSFRFKFFYFTIKKFFKYKIKKNSVVFSCLSYRFCQNYNLIPKFKLLSYLLNEKYIINFNFFSNSLIFFKFGTHNVIKAFYNINIFTKELYVPSFFKNIVNLEKKYIFNDFKNKITINVPISNKYLTNYARIFDSFLLPNPPLYSNFFFTNYYPIIFKKEKFYNIFYNKFKTNYNSNYLHFTNKLIISFFENFLKKNIYIKINSNRFIDINNYYFNILKNEYKNFNPLYFKNFFFSDFLRILWYSFFLKDLTMISNWISTFMETLNFKNHKKFINFFQNFLTKYSGMFIDVLGVKGFFFDIRGKVGVTGSSKKRHLFVKFGSLNKSSKKFKINFNQNLVRTYSGVLGLTYIICY